MKTKLPFLFMGLLAVSFFYAVPFFHSSTVLAIPDSDPGAEAPKPADPGSPDVKKDDDKNKPPEGGGVKPQFKDPNQKEKKDDEKEKKEKEEADKKREENVKKINEKIDELVKKGILTPERGEELKAMYSSPATDPRVINDVANTLNNPKFMENVSKYPDAANKYLGESPWESFDTYKQNMVNNYKDGLQDIIKNPSSTPQAKIESQKLLDAMNKNPQGVLDSMNNPNQSAMQSMQESAKKLAQAGPGQTPSPNPGTSPQTPSGTGRDRNPGSNAPIDPGDNAGGPGGPGGGKQPGGCDQQKPGGGQQGGQGGGQGGGMDPMQMMKMMQDQQKAQQDQQNANNQLKALQDIKDQIANQQKNATTTDDSATQKKLDALTKKLEELEKKLDEQGNTTSGDITKLKDGVYILKDNTIIDLTNRKIITSDGKTYIF